MNGWLWCVVGLALIILEVLNPSGFYLLMLGVSGLIVGATMLVGVPLSLSAQLAIFGLLALFGCFGPARILWSKFLSKDRPSHDAIGKTVKLNEAVGPGAYGAGELWGSVWRVKNVGSGILEPGSECVVVGVEGVTLHVQGS